MCGICGEIRFEAGSSPADWARLIELMARRGPDDDGTWSGDAYCTLGFRRLAILDLSPTGHQPMVTADGRWVMVYNGEMYNFRELKRELEQEGVRFRSTGDAEVVLYALALWGRRALGRFNGMFALALYDTVEKRLLLARDHAGIKPLYIMRTTAGILFASQYNLLLAHPWSRTLQVNSDALTVFLQRGAIPAPAAILDSTEMLEPGTWLDVSATGNVRRGRYFELPVYQEPSLYGEAAYEAVDSAVTDAVRRQLVSDVPVGTFLSGGVDSPLITAKAVASTNATVRSYSIGLQNYADDESAAATEYAQQLGVEHVLEYFTPDHALSMLDDVIEASGEPFADYSLFPTMLVAEIARRNVTVILSGDGGDELFWGYPRSFTALNYLKYFRRPYPVRYGLALVGPALGRGYLRQLIDHRSPGHMYEGLHSVFTHTEQTAIFPGLQGHPRDRKAYKCGHRQPNQVAQWIRKTEFEQYLPKVLLKVDRGSMHHSLEVRVPLLDRQVIDVAMQIDWRTNVDLHENIGKIPLRRSLEQHVASVTKPKRGFTVPVEEWLRNELKPVFEEYVLSRDELADHALNRGEVLRMFQQHCSRQADYRTQLWTLLCLALWERHHYRQRAANQVDVGMRGQAISTAHYPGLSD